MASPIRNCTPMFLSSTRPGTTRKSRWKAGQFRELKRDAPYFQAAFRVRLAGKLQELGFGVDRKRDDFEIAGIPADVLKRFSRRTALIEKVAEEKGITDPGRKAELGAETREKKGLNARLGTSSQGMEHPPDRRRSARRWRRFMPATELQPGRSGSRRERSITPSSTVTCARRWCRNASSSPKR